MDTTGGDLKHAAQDLDNKIEKQLSHQSSRSGFINQSLHEKPQRSTSSSSDASVEKHKPVEKLDSQIIRITDVKDGEEALAHLPEKEKEVLKRQLHVPEVKVTYRTLYRYATTWDLVFVGVSAVMAILGGAIMPLMTIIFGQLAGSCRLFPFD